MMTRFASHIRPAESPLTVIRRRAPTARVLTFAPSNDPKRNQDFQIYLVDGYMHRVYDELNGPLTDAIAPIPRR
jgi:hypothetical protein